MNILSISDNHDAGVVLIKDGEIVAAINEERLNRQKSFGGFPTMAIESALKIGRIEPEQINKVIIASCFTPIALMRMLNSYYHKRNRRISQFSYLLNLYIIYHVIVSKVSFLRQLEIFFSKIIIGKKLRSMGIKVDILFIDHHKAHANSAYFLSSFTEALVVTADAMGDGISLTVSIAKGNLIDRVYVENGFSGISTYYSRITELLGFKHNLHEGKVTALAAYASPDRALDLANCLLSCKDGRFNMMNYFFKHSKSRGIYKKLSLFSKEEIASAVQKNLEIEFCKLVSYWCKKTGLRSVTFAGGIFANIKLNQRIHELDCVDSIFIAPHMADGGLALGAAFLIESIKNKKLANVYLGDMYTDAQIKNILRSTSLDYTYYAKSSICSVIAKLLSQGNIVGIFNGRMEFCPRALGNRSVLYQATDVMARDFINEKLRRTEFMPFSPVTLVEHASKCYKNVTGAERTAKYMNITFDCSDWMCEKCPGAVHIDKTARPQLLAAVDNQFLYLILQEYYKLTGIPTLINTSFNLHEEPIVATPKQAIDSFLESKLDFLVLGNFLCQYKK